MKHPSELRLALFSGGDLNGLNAILTALHVRRCAKCAAEVTALRSDSKQLRNELNSLPAHVAWNPLAAEMTGNIRVGVAAAECIAPISRNPRLGWRAGMVMASATVLLMAAWWLNVPHPRRVVSNAVVLQSTPTGIELQQNNISGARNQFVRFQLVVPQGASKVTFQISGGTGDADLYVRRNSQPTTTAFDCRPFLSGNNETCTFNAPAAGTYHVGIRGFSAFTGVNLTGNIE